MSIRAGDTSIVLPRRLELALAEDRAVLADCLSARPELAELLRAQLDRYLSLFPESHWRLLYSGGIVVIPAGPSHANAYPLQYLLKVTEVLQSMSHYPGFDALLAGFRNPPQVPSVLFEIHAAEWCRTRELTTALQFSPTIMRPTGPKRPEFRWETELGDLYCECKQANEFEAKYRAASERLFKTLESAHSRKTWDPGLRLDVWIRLAGPHLDELLRDLVDTAWHHQYPGPVPWERDARLSAIVRPSGEMPLHTPDTMIQFKQEVSDVERAATPLQAPFHLTVSIERSRRAVASKLLKEARSQLPLDRSGAVFLGIGGLEAAARKTQELLVLPHYRNTPFVAILGGEGQARAISRDGQPFDQRLVEQRTGGRKKAIWRSLRAPIRRSVAWLSGRV